MKINYIYDVLFTAVNCMPLKLNYFVNKDQYCICLNHSNRYLETTKEDLSVIKAVERFVFVRESLKPV